MDHFKKEERALLYIYIFSILKFLLLLLLSTKKVIKASNELKSYFIRLFITLYQPLGISLEIQILFP